MKKILVAAVVPLLICACSRTPEQRGDSMMKKGDRANAYVYYQRAIDAAGTKAPKSLRDKYLRLTIDRARDRLQNDETLRSVDLFHNDWKKYADANTDPQVLKGYALFLCDWADSIYSKYEDIRTVEILLDDAKAYDVDGASGAKAAAIKARYAEVVLAKARENYDNALQTKEPLDMVAAEYYALCAAKYAPASANAADLVAKTRKANLSTYSAYDRALTDGRTNPDIDRFNVYLAITKQTGSNGMKFEGSIYNLSADGPVDLNADQFRAVDQDNKEHMASPASKFEKVTIDAKQESKFTLVFPTLKEKPLYLSFSAGKRGAQKWLP